MKNQVLEGPPFGEFVDPDEEYVRGQGESLGSGLLGGWSQANLGGFFFERPSREIRDELRRLLREASSDEAASSSDAAGTP
jgi:hypothetical protein